MPRPMATTRYRDKRPRTTPDEIRRKKIIAAKKKKAKAEEAEAKPAKKVKADEPGTALALIPPKKLKTLKRLDKSSSVLKKAGTTFGVPAKELYAMIQDGQMDQAIITFQRQMLATILRLIPIAEAQYRKEKKEHTAYALNSLVSQARELSADIQSSADRAGIAETIITDMMMPTFTAFVEALVTEVQTLKSALKSKVRMEVREDVDRLLDDAVRQVARTGNELFRVNANSIRDILGSPKKHGVRT